MKDYKRVLAIGVFDLFHVGHLRYLQYAKSQGQHLIAGVTPDAVCRRHKGKWPVISEDNRIEIVSALRCVDETRFLPTSTEVTDASIQWIGDWEINLAVVGGNWEGSDRWNRLTEGLADKGIDVVFAPQTFGVSSSRIVSKIADSKNDNPAPLEPTDE